MAITPLPTPPARSDTPANFVTKADAFIAALPTFVTESNAQAAALTLNATNDTSATSNLIGTGAKTFTVSAGKSFQPGMYLVIADTAAPSTNSMWGQATSYSGTSLVMNIISVVGSGTKTAWVISQSASTLSYSSGGTVNGDLVLASGVAVEESMSTVASATTPDIWTATSNIINYTGTTAATGFAAAPQAGARRTLICAGAAPFTYGANMLIDGGVSYTAAAGDEIEVYAVTTTQFRLRVKKADGAAVTSSLIGYTVFTAGGTYSKGTNKPTFVIVEVIGAGGGSGGSTAVGGSATAGGGAGAYSKKKILASALAASETVTIGTGGTAGANTGTAGGTGGTSSFGAFVSCTGGAGSAGSTGNSSKSGAEGGTATGGDINLRGGSGGLVVATTGTPGEGGISAISGGNTASFTSSTNYSPPNADANSGNGANGCCGNSVATAGAVGGSGLVIVWEYK